MSLMLIGLLASSLNMDAEPMQELAGDHAEYDGCSGGTDMDCDGVADTDEQSPCGSSSYTPGEDGFERLETVIEYCNTSADDPCEGFEEDPEPYACEQGCYRKGEDTFPLRSDEPKRRDDRKSEAFAIIPAAITLRQRAHSEKEKRQRGVAPANARKHGSHPDVRLTKHIGRSLNRYHSIGRR